MTQNRSFASRWSQRKQAARDEVDPVEDESEIDPVEVSDDKTDDEILAEFDLKDPDDMEAGDDFSAFMNSAIPARLRNRALRKLWLSNPTLANLDELLDYGEDFSNKGGVVEDIITAYKVGQGFVERVTEGADEATESDDVNVDVPPSDGEELADSKADQPSSSLRIPEDVRTKSAPPPSVVPEIASPDGSNLKAKRKKRMNFSF